MAEEEANDNDKCFSVSTEGTVLGVYYNLLSWTWKIPDHKAGAMATKLKIVIERKEVTNGLLQSIAGRIQHYALIVFNGRWEKAFLVGLDNSEEPKTTKKRMRSWNKEQDRWWLVALTLGMKGTKIPSTRFFTHINVIDCYSDAASEDWNSGAGGVVWVGDNKPWTQGRRIQPQTYHIVMDTRGLAGELPQLVLWYPFWIFWRSCDSIDNDENEIDDDWEALEEEDCKFCDEKKRTGWNSS